MIKFFGQGLSAVLPPGGKLIQDMSPNDIRGAYILYIGAGAVAAGGIISLLRSLPTIWSSLLEGLKDFRGGAAAGTSVLRTERDLSMKVVLFGSLALVVAIMLSALVLGPILLKLNEAATVYVPRVSQEPVPGGNSTALRQMENFPVSLRVDPSTLTTRETYQGTSYLVWHKQTTDDGPAGKYLVD